MSHDKIYEHWSSLEMESGWRAESQAAETETGNTSEPLLDPSINDVLCVYLCICVIYSTFAQILGE